MTEEYRTIVLQKWTAEAPAEITPALFETETVTTLGGESHDIIVQRSGNEA